MDFEPPPVDHPMRQKVRSWIERNPAPDGRTLAEGGWVVPHWPAPWGMDADPVEQLIIDEELRAHRVAMPQNPIGIGWAGPTLMTGGTAEQQDRWLPGLLSGSELWCQLFSEPAAGSDLASLTTSATRDGDEWVVNGQKVWTSLGHVAKFGILLARTSNEADRHHGITYFVCPMDLPGIEVRPIVEMTGVHLFNEVFFDDVVLGDEYRIGEVGQGWSLAKVTLANERVSLSSGGALWGRGPCVDDLLNVVRETCSAPGDHGEDVPARPVLADDLRQRLASLWIEGEILRLIRLRTLSAQMAGRVPGPEASIRKLLADEHGQRLMTAAKDLQGAAGMLTDVGPLGTDVALWNYGFLFAPALTIGGGTTQVQKSIIAERVLGLPSDTVAK